MRTLSELTNYTMQLVYKILLVLARGKCTVSLNLLDILACQENTQVATCIGYDICIVFMYNILLTATRNENVSRRYHSKTKISGCMPNEMFSAPTIKVAVAGAWKTMLINSR